MSSTGDRPANSRWRPTLPAPYRSPLARGVALRYLAAYAGALVMMVASLGVMIAYRTAAPAVRVDALSDLLIVYAVATGAAISWSWLWAWRSATAEAGGVSR